MTRFPATTFRGAAQPSLWKARIKSRMARAFLAAQRAHTNLVSIRLSSIKAVFIFVISVRGYFSSAFWALILIFFTAP
jgi:hypothetical protein